MCKGQSVALTQGQARFYKPLVPYLPLTPSKSRIKHPEFPAWSPTHRVPWRWRSSVPLLYIHKYRCTMMGSEWRGLSLSINFLALGIGVLQAIILAPQRGGSRRKPTPDEANGRFHLVALLPAPCRQTFSCLAGVMGVITSTHT